MGIHLLICHLLVCLLSHGSKRSYTVKLQSAVNGLWRLFYTVAKVGPQSLTNGVQVPLGPIRRGIPPIPLGHTHHVIEELKSDWLIESLYKRSFLCHTSHRFVSLTMRRSRRLADLAPEEPLLQQVCFICQRELDIGSLTRCQRTSCCHVFMHKPCHRQMVTTLPKCGNCRHENADYQREIVLETDEELESEGEENPFEISVSAGTRPATNGQVVAELGAYRMERRYLHTHYRHSTFWPDVPYEADPSIWLGYYYKMELFIRLFLNEPLYVHGRVLLPVTATSVMRHAVYRMFMYNTPFCVFDLIRCYKFRLLFIRDGRTDTLRVENLYLMPYNGGPPLYPDLTYC